MVLLTMKPVSGRRELGQDAIQPTPFVEKYYLLS